MKKKQVIMKLMLLVMCVGIILFIIIRNFLGGNGKEQHGNQHTGTANEGIQKAEAIRLFSLLVFDSKEREDLEYIVKYQVPDSQKKYESYLNAAITAGIIQNAAQTGEQIALDEDITCLEFRDMLWAVVDELEIDYEKLSMSFPARLKTVKEDDFIELSEFLTVYESIIALRGEEDSLEEKKLYILAIDPSSNAEKTIFRAHDGENYDVSLTKSYEKVFTQKDINTEESINHPEEENLKGIESMTDNSIVNQEDGQTINAAAYLERYVQAVTAGDEIAYIKAVLSEPALLANVYMIQGKNSEIEVFTASMHHTFQTKAPLSEQFRGKVGDLTVMNGIVTGVTIKPDVIHGKVLMTGKNQIEIEGYGVLPLHEDYRIYKLYGEMEMELTNSILVGYSVTDFVVSDGKICAALIKEKIKAENIRVLINTSNYKSIYHDSVVFSVDGPYTIDNGEAVVTYPTGDKMTIARGSKLLENGRIKIQPVDEHGKITLENVSRNYGTPKYRGSIEVAVTNQGLVVVNELSIEEYLYSVVPSEMPTSYGDEALKVQAVCARSYAFKQLMANKYSAYGAHVDDSVSCQVYNNVEENEESILAVKETYGQVITSHGLVVTAYYFSTSCGHTANYEDVWENADKTEYLTGNLQIDEKADVDFSDEEVFRAFLTKDSIPAMSGAKPQIIDTFDSGFLMYRWKVTIDTAALSRQVNASLASRYKANPESVLVYVKDTGDVVETYAESKIADGKLFVSRPVSDIGTVTGIKVTSRGSSGIIKEMMIEGTKGTVLVLYQTNVRTLLAPIDSTITRLDGSTIPGMTLLPSAFCVIDPVVKDNKVTAFTITGGGFGHGVGMSQNGVKTMTKLGKTYDQIVAHYYPGTKLSVIYD